MNEAANGRNIDISGSGLPERLPVLRRRLGMTVTELANAAGIADKTVIAIEKGRRSRVQEKTLLSLAAALHVSLEELLGLPPDAEPSVPLPAGGRRRRFRISRDWMAVILGSAALLVLLVVAWNLLLQRSSAVQVERTSAGLVGRSDSGKIVWRFPLKANVDYLDESPWHDGTWLVGLRGDGTDGGRALLLRLRDGKQLWAIAPSQDRMRAVYGEELLSTGAGFRARLYKALDIDGDGAQELALLFQHDRFCPTCVVLVRRDGTRLGQYDHKGHLYDMLAEDLDGDGKEELLLAGTNNEPCYQGATVILLNNLCHSGAAQDSLAGGDPAVPDSARIRLVMPQWGEPYMSLFRSRRIEAGDLKVFREAGHPPRVGVNVSTGREGVIVTLDANLVPLSVQPSDGLLVLAETWPDSVRALRGFPAQDWLDRVWLPKAVRFEAGHWGRVAVAASPQGVQWVPGQNRER